MAGYTWLFINYASAHHHSGINACFIKGITGIPCPSCGSTRSVISLMQGNIGDALYYNPLGIILSVIMVLVPLLVTYDLLNGKESLLRLYSRAENTVRQKFVAIPLIVLMLANWAWNIYKGM
jgi:hypothetical protein